MGPQLTPAVTPDAAVSLDVSSRNVIEVGARSRGRPRVRLADLLPLIALPLVALALLAPVLIGAQLGPVDDHEIPLMLSMSRAESWLGVWAQQMALEAARFRPLYWAQQVLETVVWGTNATGWYVDRLALLVATLGIAFALARRFMSIGYATLAAVLVVAGPQAEAWYRLGPQESLATPLLLGGFALILSRHARLGLALLVLSALTKESFLPFAALGIPLAWNRERQAAAIAGCVLAAIAAVDIPRIVGVVTMNSTIGQGRYLLPLLLIPLGLLVWALARINRSALTGCVVAAVIGLLALQVNTATGWHVLAAHWQDDIAAVRAELAAHPGAILVVAPASIGDYEESYGLRHVIPDAPAMLAPVWGTGDSNSPLDVLLVGQLSETSLSGWGGFLPWSQPAQCVEAAFDGASTVCQWQVPIRRP